MKTERLVPFGDRVLAVKMNPGVTPGGIIVPNPDNVQGSPTWRGQVLAIGPDVKSVKVDDTVLCVNGVGYQVMIDGERFIIAREDDFLGRLEAAPLMMSS